MYRAGSDAVAEITGAYFDRGQLVRSSPRSYDRGMARKVWTETAEITELDFRPDIKERRSNL